MSGCIANVALYLVPTTLVLGTLVWCCVRSRSQSSQVQHLMPNLEPLLDEPLPATSPKGNLPSSPKDDLWPELAPQTMEREETPPTTPWYPTDGPSSAPSRSAEALLQTLHVDIELPMGTPESSVENMPSVMIHPELRMAQDNLNYRLWHQMLWQIPNSQWLHTYHQSLLEVQWLCLGPDLRRFIAHAHLRENQWIWSFTQA